MYIISKFRDYYDSASAWGIDKTCVYKRSTLTLKKKTIYYDYWRRHDRFVVSKVIIGFCGKIYPCIRVHDTINEVVSSIDTMNKNNCSFFYDSESLIKWAADNEQIKAHSKYGRHDVRSKKGARIFFDKDRSSLESMFQKYKCPVFVLDWTLGDFLNPCLIDYKFGKVKDAPTTFQDIYQYLSGVIGNTERDTVNISDKFRIAARGFDKWSFRRMPGGKKRRK